MKLSWKIFSNLKYYVKYYVLTHVLFREYKITANKILDIWEDATKIILHNYHDDIDTKQFSTSKSVDCKFTELDTIWCSGSWKLLKVTHENLCLFGGGGT